VDRSRREAEETVTSPITRRKMEQEGKDRYGCVFT
jgi:hypothetical protein